jgi:hypothetical protein
MRTTICLVLLAATVANAAYVSYKTCSDKVNCAEHTCNAGYDIPSNSCENMNNNEGSFMIGCTKHAGLCASRMIYNNDKCESVPVAQQDLVCGQCFPPNKDKNETAFGKIDCAYDANGRQVVKVMTCIDSGCTQCVPKWEIPQGQCTPNGEPAQHESAIFKDLYVCEVIVQTQFKSHDCTGDANALNVLGSGRCQGGIKMACH